MSKLIVVLCVLSVLSISSAKEIKVIPYFTGIHSHSEVSTLKMNCTGDKPYKKINCNFIKTSFKKADNQFENLLQESRYKSFSEISKKFKASCNQMINIKKILKTELGPEAQKYFRKFSSKFKPLCKCKNKKCQLEKLASLSYFYSNRCKVFVESFGFNLNKKNNFKWVNSGDPKGLCNISTVTEIERSKKSDSLWTFKQKIIDVGSSSSICKEFKERINQTTTYSWKGGSDHDMGCKTISF